MANFHYLLFFLVTFTINAQNFQGKAVYKSIALIKDKYLEQLAEPLITPSKKAQLKESISTLERMFEGSYELVFDRNLSVYRKIPKIGPDGKEDIYAFMSSAYYKDLGRKIYYDDMEVGPDKFLVCDSLENYGWKLSAEEKKIGKYICRKATFRKNLSKTNSDLTAEAGSGPEQDIYDTVEAWYATEILVENGPSKFGGLPGLILEITFNGAMSKLVCTEIEIYREEKQKIVLPSDRKAITHEEFLKEMAQHF